MYSQLMNRTGVALVALGLLIAGCSGLGGDTGTNTVSENGSTGSGSGGQSNVSETDPERDEMENATESDDLNGDQNQQGENRSNDESQTLSERQQRLAVGIENLAERVEAEFDNRSLVTAARSMNTSSAAVGSEGVVRPDGPNEMALTVRVADEQPAPEIVAQLTHAIAMSIFHEPAVLAENAEHPREELVIPDRYVITVHDETGTRTQTVTVHDRLLAAYLNSGYLDNELKDAVKNNTARQELANRTVAPVINATSEDISAYPGNATGVDEAALTYFRAAELSTFVDAFETEYRWALNTTVETVQIDLEHEEVQVLVEVSGLFEEVSGVGSSVSLASQVMIDMSQPDPPHVSSQFRMQPPANMPKSGIHVYVDFDNYQGIGDQRALIPTVQALETTQDILRTGDQITYRSQFDMKVSQKYTKRLDDDEGVDMPFSEKHTPYEID